MLTIHPLSPHLMAPAADPAGEVTKRNLNYNSSVRYDAGPRTRTPLFLAVFGSVALHAGLGFVVPRGDKPTGRVVDDGAITVSLVIPQVREIEDLDTPAEERPEVRFDYVPAPRQMDVPTVTTSNDFVQALDFSSLIDRSDLRAGEIVIPDTARRMSEEVKMVFNLADLDRPPEIIFQPELQYPSDRKRSGLGARLLVEFIVDENGVPHDTVVLDSTDTAFDASARNGILRWRFRPGMKGGAKVSTRMRAPIEFRIAE